MEAPLQGHLLCPIYFGLEEVIEDEPDKLILRLFDLNHHAINHILSLMQDSEEDEEGQFSFVVSNWRTEVDVTTIT